MFKKVIAIMTATVLAASMLVACGGSTGASSSEPAAQEAAEPAAEEAAEPAAEPAADAAGEAAAATDGDLSTKKVGVCIYQFSDNFMTLFRTELEKYLIEKGFAKENITIVDDGTQVGLKAVEEGLMTGTVYNDSAGQAKAMEALAYALATGVSPADIELPEGIEMTDNKYIRLPYEKVDREKVQEYLSK